MSPAATESLSSLYNFEGIVLVRGTPLFLCLLALTAILTISGCSLDRGQEPGLDTGVWPTNLTTPIAGATFSMNAAHLPGAPGADHDGTRHGFSFFSGTSGPPLAADEPIVAVAGGTLIRIDHNHVAESLETLQFWAAHAQEPGFLGDYALDRLRGRQVWIRHADGQISRYARLSAVHPELQLGNAVEQGEVIGLMGNSGAPPSDQGPDRPPHLLFELWAADGTMYLGQGLSPLETHQVIAALFSELALPRFARQVVAKVNAGAAHLEAYPPETLSEHEFAADPPAQVAAGEAFSVQLTWVGDTFEASNFFATLDGAPLGILDAGNNAGLVWLLGAMPLDPTTTEPILAVGAVDPTGQILSGSSSIRVARTERTPEPREVSQAEYDQYKELNRQIEGNALEPALLQSLQMTQPLWGKPFQPPLEGEEVGPFGQTILFGILRPSHPRPGIEIQPDDAEGSVLAVNDGIVALTRELPIRGKTVAVIHGSGVVSIYSGLGKISVGEGASVVQGQALGSMQARNGTEDSRLLWEMHVAGTATNPRSWIGKLLPGQ